MLASITPLGERGRGSRWGTTIIFFLLGALIGGAILGGVAGMMGQAVLSAFDLRTTTRLVILSPLAGLAAAVEFRLIQVRLPGPARQVNENWFARYRGWVYGAGFGFQLGLGIVTIITTAGIYLLLVAAFLSGSAAIGVLLGMCFGAARWSAALPAYFVKEPRQLMSLSRALERFDLTSRTLSAATFLIVSLTGVFSIAG